MPWYVEFLDALPKTPTQRNQYATLKARGITDATYDGARRRDASGSRH